jgi:hypothetical protein
MGKTSQEGQGPPRAVVPMMMMMMKKFHDNPGLYPVEG